MALPMHTNIIDVRDVAKAHVHVLEHPSAKGRFIIATDPKRSSMSNLEVAQVLAAKYPTFPLPKTEIPTGLFKYFHHFDDRVDEYMVDSHLRGRSLGFDGSRIVKELGFVYDYPDPIISILDAADSMVALGIADGEMHPIQPVKFIVGGLGVLVILFLFFM